MAENKNIHLDRRQLQKPQINLARSTAGRMWLVNLCAFAAVIQSSLGDSFSSLNVALGAVAGAVLAESLVLFRSRNLKILKDGSAVATALILALFLPNRIPPVYAAVGAAFAMLVIKHSFGGLGSNWLNPAAGGWLFIRFSWPAVFDGALEASPLSLLAECVGRGVTNPQGSPLGILKIEAPGLFAAAGPLDGAIGSFLNKTVFSLSGAELPGGYLDLLSSGFPGIIADRGVLALLAGTIVITAFRVNRSWIPAVFLTVFGVLFRFAGALPYGGGFWNGDVLFALCSGGMLAAAFFLISDPATGAKSSGGIFLTAAAGGALAFLFCSSGGEPYGAVFAVLIMNAVIPLFRIFESRLLYEKRRNS